MSDLATGTVFDGRWRIGRKIGEGACAKVYEVSAVVGKEASSIEFPLVAKVIPLPRIGTKSAKDKEQRRLCDTLYHEYNVCVNNFQDLQCLPRRPLRFYGECEGYRYLIMEALERDLSDVAKQGGCSVQEIGLMGMQIIDGLKFIHQKGFFFIDIKPDNFMLKGDRLYFVDFGLAEKRPNTTAGSYSTPQDAGRVFVGTATYASIDALSGKNPTVQDEVQAMVYVLLAVLNGGILPWTGAKSDAEIIQSKQTVNMDDFADSLNAPELAVILEEARQGRVDYDYIKSLLQNLASRSGTKSSIKGRQAATKSRATAAAASTSTESATATTTAASSAVAAPVLKRKEVVKRGRKATASETEEVNLTASTSSVVDNGSVDITRRGRASRATGKVKATAAVDLTGVDLEETKTTSSPKRSRAARRKAETKYAEEEDEEVYEIPNKKRARVTVEPKKPEPKNAGAEAATTNSSKTRVKTSSSDRSRRTVASPNSAKLEIATQNNAEKRQEYIDPEDILGLEDGIPSYLNACDDDAKGASSKLAGAVASGPFSMRTSEYHRHGLSSVGGDIVGDGLSSPVTASKTGRK